MTKNSDLERLREDTEARQRAVLWPDMLRSRRSVDEFLWKGDPRATLVQRAGLGLFGIMFLFCTALSVVSVTRDGWTGIIVGGIIGSISGIAGVRLTKNAFQGLRKRRKPE